MLFTVCGVVVQCTKCTCSVFMWLLFCTWKVNTKERKKLSLLHLRAHQHFSRLMVNIILKIIVKVLCFLTVTGALYKICFAIEVTGFSDYILQQKLVMYFMLTDLAFETERLKPLKFDIRQLCHKPDFTWYCCSMNSIMYDLISKGDRMKQEKGKKLNLKTKLSSE